MTPTPRVEKALRSLKDAFLLRPEVRLGEFEAAGLCELDNDLCKALLSSLQDVRFLARDADGRYRLVFQDVLEA